MQRTVLIAVIAGLLSLLLFLRIPGRGAWLHAALDASHAPIFAAVAVLLAVLLRPRRTALPPSRWPDLPRYGLAFVLAVAIGGLIELLQSFSDRPPSLFDVCTDAAGAVAGLALLAFYERSRLPGPRPALGPAAWSLVALAIAGTMFVAWRPAQTARAYFARQQSFPMLASYGDDVALPMVSTANATATVEAVPEDWRRQSGERALRVHYGQGSSSNAWPVRYVGIELSPDWRGYSTLALDLANPGSVALPLSLRIRDAGHHWGFDPPPTLSFELPAATRATYRFEIGRIATRDGQRPLDIARIEEIFLMPADPDVAADLLLARVWLE